MKKLLIVVLSIMSFITAYPAVSKNDSMTYTFFTPSGVNNLRQFEELFQKLKKADSNDKVIIYDKGYGGSVRVMLLIMQAIEESRGEVIFIVRGPAYSANAFMTCVGDKVILKPGAFLMFHPISAGGVQRLVGDLDWEEKRTYEYIESRCVPSLLHKQEWEDIIQDGREVYIYSDGMRLTI